MLILSKPSLIIMDIQGNILVLVVTCLQLLANVVLRQIVMVL
jgi:hypothetical protein